MQVGDGDNAGGRKRLRHGRRGVVVGALSLRGGGKLERGTGPSNSVGSGSLACVWSGRGDLGAQSSSRWSQATCSGARCISVDTV
jgi:hypothetical protein